MRARCRDCRKQIIWVRRLDGRSIPLDPEPLDAYVIQRPDTGEACRPTLVKAFRPHAHTCRKSKERSPRAS